MARTILTPDQRVQMLNSQRFRDHVACAINDQASFWRGITGAANPIWPGGPANTDVAGHTRWGKSRKLAGDIATAPALAHDGSAPEQFLSLGKNDQIWNDTNGSVDESIDFMLSSGKFATYADQWFDLKIALFLF